MEAYLKHSVKHMQFTWLEARVKKENEVILTAKVEKILVLYKEIRVLLCIFNVNLVLSEAFQPFLQ